MPIWQLWPNDKDLISSRAPHDLQQCANFIVYVVGYLKGHGMTKLGMI